MKKGIFWVTDHNSEKPQLITVSVECSASGYSDLPVSYSSKSGDNFNHKIEWQRLDRIVTNGLPYNYYPRGRVEIKNGKAIIYINPDINKENVIEEIIASFDLKKPNELRSVTIKSDGSKHYQYSC